jgi:hypothetical protein
MTIPPEFSETEHFQSVCRRYLNKEIRDAFQDLGGDDWQPEVNTTRGSMRHALTHKDNDTIQMTLGRMFLYYFTFGKAQALQTPVYGMPITTYQEVSLEFRPQILLYFDQSQSEVREGLSRVTGEITYRLVNETSQSITESDLKTRANKIKQLFTTPNLFVWHKGRMTCRYEDKANGYQLTLFVTNEAEGKRIIEQVLDIENKSPNWENLSVTEKRANYPSVPPQKLIYGKSRKEVRRRPVEQVKFRYAAAHIYGVPRPVALIDTRIANNEALVQIV